MNSLPLHPSVVHVPIALALLMPLVAAGLLVAWWRRWLPRRAWLIAVGLQLVLVGSSLVALETGETEEEKVEQVLASEASLEAHEEAAERFMWATAGVLVLFLGAALIPREGIARAVAAGALLASLGMLALGYDVGHAGGELVYRDGAAAAYQRSKPAPVGAGPAYAGEYEGHDDHDEDDDD